MFHKKILLNLSLIFALLLIQYGAVVHASVHDFHDQDSLCELYQVVENHSDTLLLSSDVTVTTIPTFFQLAIITSCCELQSPSPRSRSPPLSLS